MTLSIFGSEGCGWVMHIDVVIWHFERTPAPLVMLKVYRSGYRMNEDFLLKLLIEGFQNQWIFQVLEFFVKGGR